MKIYMHSQVFPPSVGGIETVGELLLNEWLNEGMEVKVTTDTPGMTTLDEKLPITRQPQRSDVLACTRWADVVFHNHPSARTAWAPILFHKPWFATVHTWLPCYQSGGMGSLIRRSLFKSCRFLAVSNVIAGHLPKERTRVLRNPSRFPNTSYQADQVRDIDVLYVGRLVSDKGVDLLVDALAELAKEECFMRTKIVGDGPLKAPLEAKVEQLGLSDYIEFVGTQSMDQLQSFYTAARYTVVPSRWEEPFGLVAIEALACGSIPIVADSGGLPEAVGAYGRVFPNNNATALAEILRRVAKRHTNETSAQCGEIKNWLARHEPTQIAADYLNVFKQSL
ncbi:MAG TPA: hypothetical protein DCX06_03510 [Opitutae bacterium]|nr:hypothetical protein [Opitutae bacterium]